MISETFLFSGLNFDDIFKLILFLGEYFFALLNDFHDLTFVVSGVSELHQYLIDPPNTRNNTPFALVAALFIQELHGIGLGVDDAVYVVEKTHGVYEKRPVKVVNVIVRDPCLRKGKPVNRIIKHRLGSTFLRFLESARYPKIFSLSQSLVEP